MKQTSSHGQGARAHDDLHPPGGGQSPLITSAHGTEPPSAAPTVARPKGSAPPGPPAAGKGLVRGGRASCSPPNLQHAPGRPHTRVPPEEVLYAPVEGSRASGEGRAPRSLERSLWHACGAPLHHRERSRKWVTWARPPECEPSYPTLRRKVISPCCAT